MAGRGVVGAIATLVGLIGAFVKIAYSISGSLEGLSGSINALKNTMDDVAANSNKDRNRMFSELKEYSDILHNHDVDSQYIKRTEPKD